MTDYTQTGEWEFVKDLPPGRFLDIGAYDGKTFSNTRGLLEQGWTGVWVEPAAYAFDQMVANALPGVEMVNCLVGDTTGIKVLHYTRDALSTTEEGNRALWASRVAFTPVYVAQVSVADLLTAFPGPYDLISLDTEGTSLSLLQRLRSYMGETHTVIVEHDGQEVDLPGFEVVGKTTNNTILRRTGWSS